MSRSRLELIIADRFGFERALPPFETEYKFNATRRHPVTGKLRKWRFDFAWPERMVAVEAEGGTWVRGSHTRGGRYAKDCRKYNAAALDGWLVLRWTTDMVRREWGECMDELEEALLLRGGGAV
jgi:very-short-patch-repair endonuclease